MPDGSDKTTTATDRNVANNYATKLVSMETKPTSQTKSASKMVGKGTLQFGHNTTSSPDIFPKLVDNCDGLGEQSKCRVAGYQRACMQERCVGDCVFGVQEKKEVKAGACWLCDHGITPGNLDRVFLALATAANVVFPILLVTNCI